MYEFMASIHFSSVSLTINPSLKLATTMQHKRKITNKKTFTYVMFFAKLSIKE